MLRYTKWEDWSLTITNSVQCLYEIESGKGGGVTEALLTDYSLRDDPYKQILGQYLFSIKNKMKNVKGKFCRTIIIDAHKTAQYFILFYYTFSIYFN